MPAPTSSAWSATGCRKASWCARAPWIASRWCAATCATATLLERALGEYEIDTVFHLAAQTIVGIANRNPDLHLREQHPRHLEPARSLPPRARGQVDRGCVVRQGLRRPGQAALRRGDAAAGPASLRREQVVRGPDRPDLRQDLRPAGGDHALRQLLRRRRPELEPHRARHHPLRPPRRAPGDPLRRPVRPRLLLRRGRRRRLHAAGRTAAHASPNWRRAAFNFSNEIQVTVLELVRRILCADGLDPRARRAQRGRATRSAISISAPNAPGRCSTGRRCSRWTRAWSAPSPGTGSFCDDAA